MRSRSKAWSRRRVSVGLAVSGVAMVGSCADTGPDRGGLMLIVSKEGSLPIGRLDVAVASKDKVLLTQSYRVPAEAKLPTTIALVSNGSPTAEATITVSGWETVPGQPDVPLDRRDAIVTQIPTDRVAELRVVLTARCTKWVDGHGQPLCTPEGYTCDSATGDCVPPDVLATELPTYVSGDEDLAVGGARSTEGGAGAAIGGGSLGNGGNSDALANSGMTSGGDSAESIAGTGAESGATSTTTGGADTGTGGMDGAAAGYSSIAGAGGVDGDVSAAGAGGGPVTCEPACGAGFKCQGTTCVCAAPTPNKCGSSCTDTSTDKANCGACGHSCGGGDCKAGVCQPMTLASGRIGPWALAVNSTGVYWLEDKAVLAAPLTGGSVSTLAQSIYVSSPVAIAANATTVFYANGADGLPNPNYNSTVMQVPVLGGAGPSTFGKPFEDGSDLPWGVTAFGGMVYWLDAEWQVICKTPEGGGATTCRPSNGEKGFIAIDANNAYYGSSGKVYQVSLMFSGIQPVTEVWSSASPVAQIAVQAGNIYWSTGAITTPKTTIPTGSVIYKKAVGAAAATIPTSIASGLTVTQALAVDASGAYWDDGDLKRTLSDGTTTTIAAQQNAGFIALDSKFIYWTDAAGGTVKRVAK